MPLINVPNIILTLRVIVYQGPKVLLKNDKGPMKITE